MEYLIPFELAEIAVKIGFSEQTHLLYNKENEEITNKWVINSLPCPTINQLNTWIRQNHNVNIYTRIFGKKWASWAEEIPSGIEIKNRAIEQNEYDSYEESLCYALLEVMKGILSSTEP